MVEISNSKNELFSFDEEYLSIILGHYMSILVGVKYRYMVLETTQKFGN